LAGVAATAWISFDRLSTPKCAFMPKYHRLPFLVWGISESRALSAFLVEKGALMMVASTIVPVQDRDGARIVIEVLHDLFPWLRHLFADSAYSGDKLLKALAKFGRWSIEIVKRMADTVGFEVLPRRWVVERIFAWLNRNRRLAKNFEGSIASAKAWVYLASIQLLIRRMARL
jgi:transposase